jgi:hypothetical protein
MDAQNYKYGQNHGPEPGMDIEHYIGHMPQFLRG